MELWWTQVSTSHYSCWLSFMYMYLYTCKCIYSSFFFFFCFFFFLFVFVNKAWLAWNSFTDNGGPLQRLTNKPISHADFYFFFFCFFLLFWVFFLCFKWTSAKSACRRWKKLATDFFHCRHSKIVPDGFGTKESDQNWIETWTCWDQSQFYRIRPWTYLNFIDIIPNWLKRCSFKRDLSSLVEIIWTWNVQLLCHFHLQVH